MSCCYIVKRHSSYHTIGHEIHARHTWLEYTRRTMHDTTFSNTKDSPRGNEVEVDRHIDVGANPSKTTLVW